MPSTRQDDRDIIWEAARKWHKAGFAVHILRNESKAPLLKNWSEVEVASLSELKKNYRPGRNIGVRLGEPSEIDEAYLHVIDIDIRNDELAGEAEKFLEGMLAGWKMLPSVQSGSGGLSRHLYFLTDKPFRSKKLAHSKNRFVDEQTGRKRWGWEIELFGTGKQVVLPPSIHPDTGLPYRWITEFVDDDETFVESKIVEGWGLTSYSSGSSGDPEDDDYAALIQMVRQQPLGIPEEEIWKILDQVDEQYHGVDREGWLSAGMALHHEFSASDTGLRIWREYSKRFEEYKEWDLVRVWKSFKGRSSNLTTMATLKYRARLNSKLDFPGVRELVAEASSFDAAINIIAENDVAPLHIDALLRFLAILARREKMDVTTAAIKKEIRRRTAEIEKKREEEDGGRSLLEPWLAEEVRRVFYEDGRTIRFFAGNFWTFRGGVWVQTDKVVVESRILKTIIRLMETGGTDDLLQKTLIESKRAEATNALVNSVTAILARDSITKQDDPMGLMNQVVDPVMNCINGEIWFDGHRVEFAEHDPGNFFTHQIGANYDPKAECPMWDSALEGIFANDVDQEDMIRHLHEVFGYLLQPTRNHQKFIIWHGAGSNGKSLLMSILQSLMGPRAWCAIDIADMSGSGKSNHLEAALVGKLMFCDDDFAKGNLLPDGMLKKLSEQKMLTANPKHGQMFNFICRANPLILTNHWPRTKDNSHGLERRAMIFDFRRKFSESEKDIGLVDRIIRHELSGILNKAIAGFSRLQKRGRFKEPTSCLIAKQKWLNQRGAVPQFVGECVKITGKDRDRVDAMDLWDTFVQWSSAENLTTKIGRNTFYDEVSTVCGMPIRKSQTKRYLTGVKLIYEDERFENLDMEDLI